MGSWKDGIRIRGSDLRTESKITARAILLGALLIIPNVYWLVQLEMVWGGTYPSTITLLMPAVFSVSALIGLNFFLTKFLPRLVLSQGELLTVYVMLAVGLALNGCDVLQTLVHLLGTGFWYSTAENEWAELFHNSLSKWLVVSDKRALSGFFRGETFFYQADKILPWLFPLLVWLGFILLLLFVMLCINSIMRRQWTEKEKLAYPVIQLPLEITRGGGMKGALVKKIFWYGFALSAFINLLNGFNFLQPQIPQLPVKQQNIGGYFAEKPWNAIGWMPISFYPFAIGLGFLIPLDLCFSCWFFYLFWKAERVLGAAVGWQNIPGYPFPGQQISGVWICLFGFAVWGSRRHLGSVFKQVLFGFYPQPAQSALSALSLKLKGERRIANSLEVSASPGPGLEPQGGRKYDDSSEPLPYRVAVFGLIIGISLLVFFSVRAGMSALVAFAFFGIYFALSTTIVRIRAELGPPVQNLLGSGPDYILTTFFGSRKLSQGNLAVMSLFYWFNAEAYRSHPMPHQLEGFKLAERTGMSNRKLSLAIMAAVLVASLSGFWVVLQFGYRYGSEAGFGGPARWFAWASFWRLGWWLSYPSETNYTAAGFMGGSFLFTVLLLLLRARVFWWSLHPVGYALSYWWAMNLIWFPLLISSLIKFVILRYAGLRTYRKAVPFFLGLILGEYIVGGLWSLLGITLGRRMYAFWV